MILLLNTSTPVCKLILVDGTSRHESEWEAGRTLARELLGYLEHELTNVGKSWRDLSGLGVFQGPGSFTGLRIGITVLNTMADSLDIPIVATRDEQWKEDAIRRLGAGDNDRLVLPFYGADAHITRPRK